MALKDKVARFHEQQADGSNVCRSAHSSSEEKRRVSAAKAEAFCGSKISYFETSAKQATNVSAAFEEIARKAMQHEIKQEQM